MTGHLLDANVLIALTVAEHEHHDRCSEWLAGVEDVALCPITEGALLRFLLRMGESITTGLAVLRGVREHPRCHWLADSVSCTEVDLGHVRGHRQVTHAYLVGLAVANGLTLATLDSGLAGQFPGECVLIAA